MKIKDIDNKYNELAATHDKSVKTFEEWMAKNSSTTKDFDKYLFKDPNSIAAKLGYKLKLVKQIENVYFIDWVRK